MRDLIVECRENDDALRSIESEWRAIEPRLRPVPFLCFDWIDAWWRHMRADGIVIRDRLSLRVFRDQNLDLIAVAPLMLTVHPGIGPAWTRQLQPIGADANITEIRSLVAPPELEPDVVKALLSHLRDCSGTWDWFLFAGFHEHVANQRVFEHRSYVRCQREVLNYELLLAPTWAEVKREFPRNAREALRKCYNSLKREGIEFAFNVVRSRQEATQAIEHFLRLHAARADRTDTVAHPNVFTQRHARSFLLDVCQRFADRDALRIFQMTIRGTVVATRIGFVVGDSLYLYYSGYDPEFSRFSVMTTVVAEAIQYAIGEGFRMVNLSTGRDISKERWRPRPVIYREVEIVSPSLRGGLAHRSYTFAKSGLARAIPDRSHWARPPRVSTANRGSSPRGRQL
jgi:CelD/BcsL family acetyltransferase involved in cellulose biosynthesis